jgi:demethylmenaquinone methyltransferase/2-methoxy-6-polyprenyl-1,4-benzoquinol methylase
MWPQSADERQAYVDPIFSTIAPKYDFMTRALSLGWEQRWKRKAIAVAPKDGSIRRILDLASGTRDFLLHLIHGGFDGRVIALDRNPHMLGLALQKCGRNARVSFIQGDLMDIPFKSHSFDVITMGYGLRYPIDIRQVLKEIFRLLRCGGVFVCLDFGLPGNRLYRGLCFGYLLLMGSLWGLILHGQADTYWHIVESLKAYPGQEAIRKWLKGAGFCAIELREMLGGVIVIHSAVRP